MLANEYSFVQITRRRLLIKCADVKEIISKSNIRRRKTISMTLSYLNFFFSSRRRHTRLQGDWSSDVCSSDLVDAEVFGGNRVRPGPDHSSVDQDDSGDPARGPADPGRELAFHEMVARGMAEEIDRKSVV